MNFLSTSDFAITRFCFQRALAFIYLIAFLIAANQFRALVGEHGLLPAKYYIQQTRFWDSPSIFYFHASDTAFLIGAWAGVLLSLLALLGISDSYGVFLSVTVWALLWMLYMSFVNIGQVFYGFGWESLLLETGFLSIFLGPRSLPAPTLIVWLFRWILFRLMFGAGMIKLRGDACWRDLTCMYYHYETQPLPNPLSWYFHNLPKYFHKIEVLFNHFIELVVPLGFFSPRPVIYIAGILTFLFQVMLIYSGNLSWLNYITLVLCLSCFDDAFWLRIFPSLSSEKNLQSATWIQQSIIGIVFMLIVYLSYRPARNLFSRDQMMNASFDSLHLVNTYGAFGSISKERLELVLEGTTDVHPGPLTQWKEYQFKGKPGDIHRMPSIVSPYHYKLDWQMWFAAMSSYRYHPWILNLVAKLLVNDPDILSLMDKNPFDKNAPKYIRIERYRYRFADAGSKDWWQREKVDEYLPPLSLDTPEFTNILLEQGWM